MEGSLGLLLLPFLLCSISVSVYVSVSPKEEDLWVLGMMGETSEPSLFPISLSCPGAQFLPKASSP